MLTVNILFHLLRRKTDAVKVIETTIPSVLIFEPDVFINDFDGLIVASTHGSPWRYDTFVPVIFAGAGLPGIMVSRAVTPYDIAPTLAAYLGVKPPSGAIGAPLSEVLPK